MTWTPEQWRAFCLLIEQGWPGEFGIAAREAWRTLLDRYDPAACEAALHRLIAKGSTFRPSVAELVGEVGADPGAPTFAEAVELLYGPHGVLRAQPPTRWASEHERRALTREAITARAEASHPLIAAFVRSQGIEHLSAIPLDDPQWGPRRRAELQRAWQEFAERACERQAVALAAGRAPREGLTRFDPLAALGQKQLTDGEQA